MAAGTTALQLRGAARHFGEVRALEPTDLDIQPGERVLLAGPSGGGKSTLLRLLQGALAPTAGEVMLAGRPLSGLSSAELRRYRQRCAFVEPASAHVPSLRASEVVLSGFGARWPWYRVLASSVWPMKRVAIESLLAAVGLAERSGARMGELSAGQQQRVSLVSALATKADVVLADEPTSALDTALAERVMSWTLDRAGQWGAPVVVATHRVSLHLHAFERLVGLREGRLLLDKPTSAVTEQDLRSLYAGSEELG